MDELSRLTSDKWIENTFIYKIWLVNEDNIRVVFEKACKEIDLPMVKISMKSYMKHVKYDYYDDDYSKIYCIISKDLSITRIFLDNMMKSLSDQDKIQEHLKDLISIDLIDCEDFNSGLIEFLDLYIEYGFKDIDWILKEIAEIYESDYIPYFAKHGADISNDNLVQCLYCACEWRNIRGVEYILQHMDSLKMEQLIECVNRIFNEIKSNKGDGIISIFTLLIDFFSRGASSADEKNGCVDQIMMMFCSIDYEFGTKFDVSVLECLTLRGGTQNGLSECICYLIKRCRYHKLKYLLKQDRSNNYALYMKLASRYGHFDIVKLMWKKGCILEHISDKDVQECIDVVCANSHNNTEEEEKIIDFLYDKLYPSDMKIDIDELRKNISILKQYSSVLKIDVTKTLKDLIKYCCSELTSSDIRKLRQYDILE